jgi:hypothetical protein
MTEIDRLAGRNHQGRATTHHDTERVFRDALALLIVKELRRAQRRGGPLKTVVSVGAAAGSGTALALAYRTLKHRAAAPPQAG